MTYRYNRISLTMKNFLVYFRLFLGLSLIGLFISTSVWQPLSEEENIRPFTRPFEFNYQSWTINAVMDKLSMASLGFNHYLTLYQDRKILQDYFQLLNEKNQMEYSIDSIYSDPEVGNPEEESSQLQSELAEKQAVLKKQSSLAEVIIQKQISTILDYLDLAELGQPFPPVLYHATDLPKQIVISPRDEIKQSAAISLHADLNLEDITKLENDVEENTDYSALVVDVGGVGTYPTMVISTTSMPYLLETVAHEWIHNYLAFRPLGMRYSSTPELRTMNETTATIAGQEISDAVIKTYYQDLIPVPKQEKPIYEVSWQYDPMKEDTFFNFNREMYQTRLHVDELLSEGKIQEAEEYMEDQRQVFWENGFQIRKLNQAYFAFHGAYADETYSAAGEDPVGAAVRSLRSRSSSLAEFMDKMSGLKSYEELYMLINSY